MKHPTYDILRGNSITSIVLVGPPAGGKSTVRSLLSDYDVHGSDLESFHNGSELKDGWKQEIVSTISHATSTDRSVVCIEGAISTEEVDFVRENSKHTLVVLVDVPDDADRVDRFIDRELTPNNDRITSDEKIAELQLKSYQRRYEEMPYPEHDVSIINKNSTTTKELSRRCARLVSLIDDDNSISVPGE